jgi:uncharacterized protein YutE (UPF0331/DUF86 family)
MNDIELLSNKISFLRDYLRHLEQADDITWAKYTSDIRSKAFVERYLHLCVEEVLDICNHLIAENDWREPRNFRDLFTILAEQGVVSEQDVLTFQNMASFRNLLVHRYEKIDDKVVFGIFRRRLNDFHRFIEAISAWIRAATK